MKAVWLHSPTQIRGSKRLPGMTLMKNIAESVPIISSFLGIIKKH